MDKNNSPFRKIDFGFVLLPQPDITGKIKQFAQELAAKISTLPKMVPLPVLAGSAQRRLAINPHLSIGQYGILNSDLPLLFEIIKKTSHNFSSVVEEMKDKPVHGDNTISLEATHIKDKVNPEIKELFSTLRTCYFDKIGSRCPLNQALYQRSQYLYKNPPEVALIDQYFQNWGIPEGNRMRPHFTLVYNHVSNRESLENLFSETYIPPDLKHIKLETLAIVEIDFWGNGLKVLYTSDLTG